MKNIVGILREGADKHGEKRTAITPKNAKRIVDLGFKLLIEPAVDTETEEIKRAFSDSEYQNVGAEIKNELSGAKVIFGLKEINTNKILPNKTYLFFSHTHKGQKKNMQMLKELVKNNSTLIDYELITDTNGRRLITAFTYIAGNAGMVDTLWALGKKLLLKGITNPFENIVQSVETGSIDKAKTLLNQVGEEIISNGTPQNIPPIICCVLGRGKTSVGAGQILDELPVEDITVEQLPSVFNSGSKNKIYRLVLEVYDIYKLKKEYISADTGSTEEERINHYLQNPEMYETNMENVLPYVTVLMNCIIWSDNYPRVLTNKLMKKIYTKHKNLMAIGDVTCDPNGSIEFSKETWIDNPVYNYDPLNEKSTDGFYPDGITVMAVTNLPCEFSADASEKFSDQLLPFLEDIISADFELDFTNTSLPEPIKNAVIMWRGKFTDCYKYMEEYLD